jgi:hypothetical protein
MCSFKLFRQTVCTMYMKCITNLILDLAHTFCCEQLAHALGRFNLVDSQRHLLDCRYTIIYIDVPSELIWHRNDVHYIENDSYSNQ